MALLPTGTLTFLFTDIEGSTKLWEAHPEAMRGAVARHDALLRQAVEQNNGVVFKTTGDGIAAAFALALDALAATLDAQQALLTEPWPTVTVLRSRMGLHTGSAELRDGDYFGTTLNRCARLMAAGHGGQTLLSDVTHQLTRDTLPPGVSLRLLGKYRLKDLTRPETIFQLEHPTLVTAFPSLRTLDATPNNLPQQVTSFIGREKAIADVTMLLGKTRLLTLIGSGGAGKTRLSLQAAADLLEQYPDGVWLVELAPLSEPSLVPQTVASVLGIKEQAGQAMTQTLTSGLKDKKLLLLLDNCEHLLLACAQMVAALIRTCHNLTVLATSREALGIGGEYVYRIPSLSLPDSKMSKAVTAASLSQFEAVRLFIDRAQAVRSDFAVTNQNAPALAQLCYRLDGIPLAIELAAARVRSLTVEQINDKLDSRFRLLTGGDRSALPRQQTLRALIDWSYDLLNQTEKTLLARLSVFAGGWILEAAEAVCVGDVVEDWEVLDLLTNLVDKSLILSEETSGEQAMRYRMLETVRQYAQERLSASEDESEVREQHVSYFIAVVEEAEPKLSGPEQLLWLNRLEAEHDNLRAALDSCAAQIDAAAALSGLRLTAALQSFWAVRDYLSEGRVHLARALAQRQVAEAGATDALGKLTVKQAVARALNGAGTLAFFQSDYVAARALYELSLPLYREIGERGAVPAALMNIGNVAFCQGDYAAAQRVCQESLALLRELGDSGAIPSALMNVGYATFCLGDYATARSLFEEGLVLCRESGNKQAIAGMLGNLGNVVGIQGDYSVARSLLEESLALQHEIGSKGGLADGLYYLGSLTFHEGDYPAAGALYDESLVLYREIGNKEGVIFSLSGRASVSVNREDEVDGRQAALRWAATLWGASGALEESLGAPLPPHYRSEQDVQVAKARAMLNDDVAWIAAWAVGAALSWEQAVKLALRE